MCSLLAGEILGFLACMIEGIHPVRIIGYTRAVGVSAWRPSPRPSLRLSAFLLCTAIDLRWITLFRYHLGCSEQSICFKFYLATLGTPAQYNTIEDITYALLQREVYGLIDEQQVSFNTSTVPNASTGWNRLSNIHTTSNTRTSANYLLQIRNTISPARTICHHNTCFFRNRNRTFLS